MRRIIMQRHHPEKESLGESSEAGLVMAISFLERVIDPTLSNARFSDFVQVNKFQPKKKPRFRGLWAENRVATAGQRKGNPCGANPADRWIRLRR